MYLRILRVQLCKNYELKAPDDSGFSKFKLFLNLSDFFVVNAYLVKVININSLQTGSFVFEQLFYWFEVSCLPDKFDFYQIHQALELVGRLFNLKLYALLVSKVKIIHNS